MTEHHEVTLLQPLKPDDEGKGIQAIIRTLLANPVAAIELFIFCGGIYGLYYTNNSAITEAKATSEQHYKDLSADILHNNERLLARIDALFESDKQEIARIDAIFTRGDTRWAVVQAKQGESDVRFTKLETGVNYIIRVLDKLNGNVIPPLGTTPTP